MVPEENNMSVDEAMKSSFDAVGTVGGTPKQPSDMIEKIYELEKENNSILKSIQENMNITKENSNPIVDEIVSQLDKTEIIDTAPVAPEVPGVDASEKIENVVPEQKEVLEELNSDTNTFSPVNVDSISLDETESVEKLDAVSPVLTEIPSNEFTLSTESPVVPVEEKKEETENILSMNDILASENKVEEALAEEEKITPIPLEEPIIPITPVENPSVTEEVKPAINIPEAPKAEETIKIENKPIIDQPATNNDVIDLTKSINEIGTGLSSEPVKEVAPQPITSNKSFSDVTQLYVDLSEVKTGENQKQRILSVDSNDSLKNVSLPEKTLVMNQ